MWAYLLHRLGLSLLTLPIVLVMVFALLRIMPGSAAELMVSEQGYATDVAALREKLGLNDPVYVQFWDWASGLLRGDLGESLYSGRPIRQEMADRLPVSIRLGLLMMAIGWMVGVPLGVLAAVKQRSVLDEVSRTVAVIFLALPTFWLATMFLVFPSIWFGWAPPLRYVSFSQDPVANLKYLIWPAVIGGLPISAGVVRVTRTLMLEVLRQDYVRTAYGKGLGAGTVLYRHALRNAAPPLVTIMGLQVATVFTGSVIVEQIFGIPGMGRYVLEAAGRRDYPVVQALLLIGAALILVSNLVVDLAYSYLDPRIRLK